MSISAIPVFACYSSASHWTPDELQFATHDQLKDFLKKQGLVYEDHLSLRLFQEIQQKETVLMIDATGELVRKLEVVNIAVTARDKAGIPHELVETRQVSYQIVGGKETDKIVEEKARGYHFVGEKMKAGEDVREAACRGIEEELHLKINQNQLSFKETKVETGKVGHFPGLKSIYTIHVFETELPREVYEQHKNGFKELEIKSNGTIAQYTYFEWQPKK